MRNSLKSIILCSLFFVGLTSFDDANKQLEEQQTPCEELAVGQAYFLYGEDLHTLEGFNNYLKAYADFNKSCVENGGNENGTETLPVLVIQG